MKMFLKDAARICLSVIAYFVFIISLAVPLLEHHFGVHFVALAQIPAYELVCPAGTTVFPSIGTVTDNSTGLGRQWLCYNNVTSAILFNDGITTQFSIKSFGAVGGARFSSVCSATQNGTLITDATAPFFPSDTNKLFTMLYPPSAANALQSGGIDRITYVSPTQVQLNGDTIIGGVGTFTGQCTWATQLDTKYFKLAYASAHAVKSGRPEYNSPTVNYQTSVICPPDGYMVDGTILNEQESSSNNLGVSLIGNNCHIYLTPTFSQDSSGIGLIYSLNTSLLTITGLYIHGGGWGYGFGGGVSSGFAGNSCLLNINGAFGFSVHDNTFTNWGTNGVISGGAANVCIESPSGTNKIEHNFVQTSPALATNGALYCSFCASTIFDSNGWSNNFINKYIVNSGSRTTQSSPVTFLNDFNDECGNNQAAPNDGCFLIVNTTVICKACTAFGSGTNPALNIDANSELDTDGGNFGAFNSGSNIYGTEVAANGRIFATDTTFRGNGTGAAIKGPASGTAFFYDLGGNPIQNWTNTTCNNSTPPDTVNCNGKPAITPALQFSGNVNFIFPISPGTTSQLGARQLVIGTAPTFAVTGFGTSPTVTVQTGSTDAAGAVTITAGTAPAASGTFTLTFTTTNGAYGTNLPVCSFNLANGTGTWNALAQQPVIQTPSTTSVLANWADNSVALTATSTYGFTWNCYGK